MKEEMARRRMDAAERMKMLSGGGGGDPAEAFSPVKTPTHKVNGCPATAFVDFWGAGAGALASCFRGNEKDKRYSRVCPFG